MKYLGRIKMDTGETVDTFAKDTGELVEIDPNSMDPSQFDGLSENDKIELLIAIAQ